MYAEPLAAQTAEQLTFVPAGGRTLLNNIVTSHPPADELQAILTGKHTRRMARRYLKSKTKSVPALQKFSDQELTTLADYLSFNMPLASGQSAADLAIKAPT